MGITQLLESLLTLQSLIYNWPSTMASPHFVDANVLIACATAMFAAVIYGEEVELKFFGILLSYFYLNLTNI